MQKERRHRHGGPGGVANTRERLNSRRILCARDTRARRAKEPYTSRFTGMRDIGIWNAPGVSFPSTLQYSYTG